MFPVKNADELKSLAFEVKWQWFEKLVGWIFEQNDFTVTVNKVEVFGEGRRQYDVLAERYGRIFAVECKRWKGRRYRSCQLRKAAEEHGRRCGLLAEKYKKRAIPLIVTLVEEDVSNHGGVAIVPIEKLNAFLNSFEEWF